MAPERVEKNVEVKTMLSVVVALLKLRDDVEVKI